MQKDPKNKTASGKVLQEPVLYVCATPIGNLSDASFRLLETLKSSDLIIAEDTRSVRNIFSRYDIKKPAGSVISYQDYAGPAKTQNIIEKIKNTSISCLVSESGMPAIQDPGYKIIRSCIENGLKVSVVPGPNAAISALVISGLPTDSFLFVGFLPKTAAKRKEKLLELAYYSYTMIFYESSLRIAGLLGEMADVFGNRQACLAREITKIYEEVIRASLEELSAIITKGKTLKGEIVLVVEGYKKGPLKDFNSNDIIKEFARLSAANISRKDIFKIIQSKYDIDRQTLYNITTGKSRPYK
ncbi:MAG: 16S rRNA (cytidine(1402)-2'-O)-methyltransferase [Actinobacteria bacterium]|nr:16S rRNA (cytidine(1402)-2'-O)-methyltransferase [Actinomycetota bacterium]